jgi:NAD(P)-dependent dehydrogenase (short-subunit alcohol dehydrogenase family)
MTLDHVYTNENVELRTDMTNVLPEAQKAALVQQIPMNRLGSADEIASAVLFLAGEGGSYITAHIPRNTALDIL